MEKLILKRVEKRYEKDEDMRRFVRYVVGISTKKKTKKPVKYWNCKGCRKNIDKICDDMISIQKRCGKIKGRRLYHIIVIFPKDIDDINIVRIVAEDIAELFFEGRQVVYGIHDDTDNLHIHFAVNSVSYIDGAKWHLSNGEFALWRKDILTRVNNVLMENGYTQLLCYRG